MRQEKEGFLEEMQIPNCSKLIYVIFVADFWEERVQ